MENPRAGAGAELRRIIIELGSYRWVYSGRKGGRGATYLPGKGKGKAEGEGEGEGGGGGGAEGVCINRGVYPGCN